MGPSLSLELTTIQSTVPIGVGHRIECWLLGFIHPCSEVGHCEWSRYSKRCLSGAAVSHGTWGGGRGPGAIEDLVLHLCFKPFILQPPFRVARMGPLSLTTISSTCTIPGPEKGNSKCLLDELYYLSPPQLFRLSIIVPILQMNRLGHTEFKPFF